MTAIRITNFSGIIPKLANRMLPQNSARSAANCSIISGELRPMRKPKKVYELALASAIKSIYRVDDTTFFCWPTEFVQMTRAPVEGEARYCYTGDGVPKITTKAIGTPVSASGTPALALSLGIPTPLVATTVVPTGGVGVNSSRLYAYTFYSANNEESSFSPVSVLTTGKVDASWAISGMEPTPANSGTVTAISKTATTITLTLSANHYLRPTDQATIAGVVGMTDANGVWTIAAVPANNQITITLTTSQTYTSGGTWNRVNAWGACTKRLYRTSSGTKADFQLVAIGISGTTFTDTLTDLTILGDSAVSDGWIPPPENMIGLVALSNGVLAGFYGNTVCMSEPYQPHAWPTKYRKKMSSDIVGIAAFDTNLGVATTGNPVVLAGSDPDQMTPIKHIEPLPCVSRASVCGVGDGTVYSSKNGLVKINISGAGIYTTELFGPEEWNRTVPASIKVAYDGIKIFIATVAGVIYIFNTKEGGALTTTSQLVDGMYVDMATGDLFFATAKKVNILESFTSAPMTTDWWSRENILPQPVNMGAVRLEYDLDYANDAAAAIAQEQADAIASNALKISTIGGRGSIGASAINVRPINGSYIDPVIASVLSVSFSFYSKNKLIFTSLMQDGVMAAMPSGYKSDSFSIRIQANTQVKAVVLADTPGNLRNA